jgi:hypothetical protein
VGTGEDMSKEATDSHNCSKAELRAMISSLQEEENLLTDECLVLTELILRKQYKNLSESKFYMTSSTKRSRGKSSPSSSGAGELDREVISDKTTKTTKSQPASKRSRSGSKDKDPVTSKKKDIIAKVSGRK